MNFYAFLALALGIALILRESKAATVRGLGRDAVMVCVREIAALRNYILSGSSGTVNYAYEKRRNEILEATDRFYREAIGATYDKVLVPEMIRSFVDETNWSDRGDYRRANEVGSNIFASYEIVVAELRARQSNAAQISENDVRKCLIEHGVPNSAFDSVVSRLTEY